MLKIAEFENRDWNMKMHIADRGKDKPRAERYMTIGMTLTGPTPGTMEDNTKYHPSIRAAVDHALVVLGL